MENYALDLIYCLVTHSLTICFGAGWLDCGFVERTRHIFW